MQFQKLPQAQYQKRSSIIAEDIVQRIRCNELSAGMKLPSERIIAEQLGVSRPSVREAISALQIVGVLESRPGDGTYVCERLEFEDLSRKAVRVLEKNDSPLELLHARKAGVQEFTHAFVHSQDVRTLMPRIRMEFDPAIEAKGYDKMRSRVEVTLKNGKKIVRNADDRYRGGPENPLSDDELKEKFTDCSQSIVSDSTREEILKTVFELENLPDIDALIARLSMTV